MSEQIAPRRRGRPSRNDVYRLLAIRIRELRDRRGGLPSPIEASGIWKGIWHGEVHHSTAIEGNTLVQDEVAQLLESGLAVGDRTLREYLEVKGYADAAEWVYGQVEPSRGRAAGDPILTLADVRRIHHAAMAPVWEVTPHPEATRRESPGSYREHGIRPFREG